MSIKILYFTITNNCKRFVDDLDVDKKDIYRIDDSLPVDELQGSKYIVVAPTYVHDLTSEIDEAIDDLGPENCLGVMGSGNRNFDDLYVFTAKDLSKKYNIPVLFDFEYFGLDSDIEKANKIIKELEETI